MLIVDVALPISVSEPEQKVVDDVDSCLYGNLFNPLYNSCIWQVLDCGCKFRVPNSHCSSPRVYHCVVWCHLSVMSEMVVYLFLVVASVCLAHSLDSIVVVCACNIRSSWG